MSFSTEFYTKNKEDAVARIKSDYLPEEVRSILLQGLEAVKEGEAVYVKAFGHVYKNDYTYTTADIKVQPVIFWTPKPSV